MRARDLLWMPALAVVVSLAATLFSGLGTRYLAPNFSLGQAGVITLSGIGLICLPLLRVAPWVRYCLVVFTVVVSLATFGPMMRSVEFGLRGWLSVMFPVLAAIAVATLSQRLNGDSRAVFRRALTFLFGVALAINSSLTIKQAFLGLDSFESAQLARSVSTYASGDNVRLMGAFETGQDLGAFFAVAVPACLVLALKAERPMRSTWLWIYIAAMLATFLSLTRTSLIAVVIVSAFALFVWSRGSVTTRSLRALVVLPGLALIVAATLANWPDKRVQDSVARSLSLFDLGNDRSFSDRTVSTLPRALDALSNAPFGSGVGSAGPISQAMPQFAPFGILTTDNGYLMIAIQVGVVALAILLTVMFGIIIRSIRTEDRWTAASGAAMMGLLVAFVSAGYWSLTNSIVVLALIVGLGAGTPFTNPPTRGFAAANSRPSSRRPAR